MRQRGREEREREEREGEEEVDRQTEEGGRGGTGERQ